MSFEVQMQERRESKSSEKKSIAFNALTDGSKSSGDENEEIAFMKKNFRKLLKYRKMNNFKKSNHKNSGNQFEAPNNIGCYNCDELGHYKKNYPHPEKQIFPSNNDFTKKKKEHSLLL